MLPFSIFQSVDLLSPETSLKIPDPLAPDATEPLALFADVLDIAFSDGRLTAPEVRVAVPGGGAVLPQGGTELPESGTKLPQIAPKLSVVVGPVAQGLLAGQEPADAGIRVSGNATPQVPGRIELSVTLSAGQSGAGLPVPAVGVETARPAAATLPGPIATTPAGPMPVVAAATLPEAERAAVQAAQTPARPSAEIPERLPAEAVSRVAVGVYPAQTGNRALESAPLARRREAALADSSRLAAHRNTGTEPDTLSQRMPAPQRTDGHMPQFTASAQPQAVAITETLNGPTGQPGQAAVAAAPTPAEPSSAASQLSRAIAIPVGQPAWGESIGERVLLMASNRLQSAEIRLTPAELGPLRVQVAVNDGMADVIFHVQHATTREAIEQAMPRLRELLADNGLTLNQTSVSEQDVHEGGRHTRDNDPQAAVNDRADAEPSPDTAADTADDKLPRRHRPNGLLDTFA